jgi:acetyltransferase-like isoleucine patch superfamily enzyme
METYFTKKELIKIGFVKVGKNSQISKKVSFINIINATLGSNVRIDDYCVIKGRVQIGSFVHISNFCLISGSEKNVVVIKDRAGLSNNVSLLTSSDHYVKSPINNASDLPNKILKIRDLNLTMGNILLKEGCLIGAYSLILPNTVVGISTSIGAYSILFKKIDDFIYYSNRNILKVTKRKKDKIKILSVIENFKKYFSN